MILAAPKANNGGKKALILGGGGMRVAYQAGVIKALEEDGAVFDHIDGTSGGLFNTAMLASGLDSDKIINNWHNLKLKQFISGRKFGEYLRPWRIQGLGDADNIKSKVFPHFEINIQTINQQKGSFSFNVCNFSNKNVEALTANEVFVDHLIAGVSLPIMMPAIEIEGSWYIDAVWIKDANLMAAVKQGAEELWLVWGIGNYPGYQPGPFQQYVHSIEMSANGALLEEFEQIKLINQNITNGISTYGQKKPVKLFVIKPPLPLPLDPDLFFNKINTRELVNMGYQDGKSYCAKRPIEGEILDYMTTKTRDIGDFFCLRGTYGNTLAWDNEPTPITFYTYFRFSKLNSEEAGLDLYASIYIAKLNQEFIANKPIIHKKKGKGKIEAAAEIFIAGRAFQINSHWSISGPWSTIFGLDFKQVNISIFPKEGASLKPILEGLAYQSFWDRLLALTNFLIRKKNGGRGGLRFKYKILKKFMDYGI